MTMNLKYIEHDNELRFSEIPNLSAVKDKIPAGVYTYVCKQTKEGATDSYLAKKDKFILPAKLYGTVVGRTERILAAYKALDKNMGVLLSGLAGAGKSLLIKYIANKAVDELGMPVIIFTTDSVNKMSEFLDKTPQPCVILLDEFEKMTYPSQQEQLLTVFDGMYTTKNLFLLTVNDKNQLTQFLFSRPSRLRYVYDYNSIETEVIEAVLEDKLTDKSKLDQVSMLLSTAHKLSFDVLNSFIEEVNIFPDKDPKVLFENFNTKTNTRDEGYQLECLCGEISISNIFQFKIDTYGLECAREGKKFRINFANKNNSDGFNKRMPWDRDPIATDGLVVDKAEDLQINFNHIQFKYTDKDGKFKENLIKLSSQSLNPIGENPTILKDKTYTFKLVK